MIIISLKRTDHLVSQIEIHCVLFGVQIGLYRSETSNLVAIRTFPSFTLKDTETEHSADCSEIGDI